MPAVISVAGPIEYGDRDRFQAAIGDIQRGVVFFRSNGGNLVDGIEIGKTIRLRGLMTAVAAGDACYSACALAWLGGSTRALSIDGTIGFHAASLDQGGIRVEKGAGNALVGAYLTKIGLSEDAIFFITDQPPDRFNYLNEEAARRYRIDVLFLDYDTEGAPPPAPSEPALTTRNAEEAAMSVVMANLRLAGAATPAGYRDFILANYADTVEQFGTRKPRSAVVADALAYKTRWPELQYSIEGPLDVRCGASICEVSGIGRFAAHSPARNARSAGEFSFRYVLENRAGRMVIVTEESTVLQRKAAPLSGNMTLVRNIQTALADLGCNPGPVDGIWGRASANAMARFNRANNVMLPVKAPTAAAWKAVSGADARRCLSRPFAYGAR